MKATLGFRARLYKLRKWRNSCSYLMILNDIILKWLCNKSANYPKTSNGSSKRSRSAKTGSKMWTNNSKTRKTNTLKTTFTLYLSVNIATHLHIFWGLAQTPNKRGSLLAFRRVQWLIRRQGKILFIKGVVLKILFKNVLDAGSCQVILIICCLLLYKIWV